MDKLAAKRCKVRCARLCLKLETTWFRRVCPEPALAKLSWLVTATVVSKDDLAADAAERLVLLSVALLFCLVLQALLSVDDAYVGIVDAVEASGQLNNTYVLLSSDHGARTTKTKSNQNNTRPIVLSLDDFFSSVCHSFAIRLPRQAPDKHEKKKTIEKKRPTVFRCDQDTTSGTTCCRRINSSSTTTPSVSRWSSWGPVRFGKNGSSRFSSLAPFPDDETASFAKTGSGRAPKETHVLI